LHAGEGAHAGFDFAVERDSARLVVAGLVRVHEDVENVAGIEAEIEGLNFLQAPDEKSSDDEESERARNLRDNQEIAKAGMPDAEGIALATFVQDRIHVRGGGAQSGQQADH
jgi:hypothetical protein